MPFDVIKITDEEVAKLTDEQLLILQKAQQEKAAIERDYEITLFDERCRLARAGVLSSSMLYAKSLDMQILMDIKKAELADNTVLMLKIKEPKKKEESGGTTPAPQAPYTVDYSLSYNERYIIVREYYLGISDRTRRMQLYASDEIAKDYLSTYYKPLYNVLATY